MSDFFIIFISANKSLHWYQEIKVGYLTKGNIIKFTRRKSRIDGVIELQ